MAKSTEQHNIFQAGAQSSDTIQTITIGMVVDTNDPQQMGRIRAICPAWGDNWSSVIEDLPWAVYMSPFGGQVQVGTRGPGVQQSVGGVAYGLWSIPTVGSQVAIVCVDGNPSTRMYIGCIYDQFTPHTMPHGRFMYDDHPELEKTAGSPAPYGPYTSAEKYIQPLAENLKYAFGHKEEPNYEFRTRAADYSVSRVDVGQLDQTYSKVQDDKDVSHDGWTSTQGYQASRTDPHAETTLTDKNYDSMVTSMVTPGFHALSMDDRQENCRIRIRTTSGHQIIMDDTNERIYISTAQGNNWVELDQNGNIDIYSANKINVHSEKELNFTSDETVRIYGKKGVHIKSDEEVRIDAGKDVHLKAGSNIRAQAGATLYLQSGGATNVNSGSGLNLQAGGTTNILAGGNIVATGAAIHLNGPGAGSAAASNTQPALWTNRIPQHEPWARTMTSSDQSHSPEFDYTSASVNKIERGVETPRGMFWRR